MYEISNKDIFHTPNKGNSYLYIPNTPENIILIIALPLINRIVNYIGTGKLF